MLRVLSGGSDAPVELPVSVVYTHFYVLEPRAPALISQESRDESTASSCVYLIPVVRLFTVDTTDFDEALLPRHHSLLSRFHFEESCRILSPPEWGGGVVYTNVESREFFAMPCTVIKCDFVRKAPVSILASIRTEDCM
jgi:hypothetical protein